MVLIFDWEHLSQHHEITQEQREIQAKVLLKLRQKLDAEGMQNKQIGYTTRFNAFFDDTNRPMGFMKFDSDGEGLSVEHTLNQLGSSLNEVVDWVNIMAYDVAPSQVNGGWNEENYESVFISFAKYLDKLKIVMGFEPGGQAAGGVWEGVKIDKTND